MVSSIHASLRWQSHGWEVKDLGSRNGTFVNGEKVTETVLKPGQVLRLGQIEMRLETDAPAGGGGAAAGASKKPLDHTMVMQRGVKMDELEQGTRGGFDTTSKGFSKKDNKANKVFWILAGVVGFVIICLLIYVAMQIGK